MPATTAGVITPNSMKILQERYLDGGTIDDMWDRVSGGNPTYRNLMSSLRFLPNSPALFNLGKNNRCTSSACFTFEVSDRMCRYSNGEMDWNSILGTKLKAAEVAKAGGGVGYYLGNLRPKGSAIKTVHRKACGPVAVLKEYHGTSTLITQGGKRELAQMAVLPCWHQDIHEFIHCKDEDPQSMGSFNISVNWTDEWVSRLDGDPLVPIKIRERQLWDEQCKSAWKTGCPGMFFVDHVNRDNPNPHLGLVYTPNPCAEAYNRNNGVCSLGSLALPRYYVHGQRDIDWKLLEEDIWNATMFMDDILDRNEFPHPDITEASALTRRLGLGVMGWADLLGLLHIHYDTSAATDLAREISRLMKNVSHAASEEMGKTKGPYKGYSNKSLHSMRRNETNTSIAPTGTIAIIAGVWGSIEPHFSIRCERTTSEGLKLQDGIQDQWWEMFEGFVPKVADQISPEWHIRHQAAWQENIDLGISKTINLPNSATVEDVSKAYRMLYDMNCRGGTIFRDGCRKEQVLVKKTSTKSVYSINNTPEIITSGNGLHTRVEAPSTPIQQLTPTRSTKRKMPDLRPAKIHKFKVSGTEFFLITGYYPDDMVLGEIFISGSFGSTMAGLLNAFCITFSISLQNGTPLEDLINNHINTRFEPCGLTDNKLVPHCTSVTDFIVRYLAKIHLTKEAQDRVTKDTGSGAFCPQCGQEAIYQSGCLMCPHPTCGWSRCG